MRGAAVGGRELRLRIEFRKLNEGWDAEPDAPRPDVRAGESGVTLTFYLSLRGQPEFREYDCGQRSFPGSWRYRLGAPNDEGWHKGHCRFGCLAPYCGDFYEVTCGLTEDRPKDWVLVKPARSQPSRHFLFYFRDETFECDLENWSFRTLPVSDADYARLRAREVRVTLEPVTFVGFLQSLFLEPVRLVRRWLRLGQ